MASSGSFYGGIEGGATGSRCVIVDGAGGVVGRSSGDGTNYFVVGLDAVVQRVTQLVRDAKCDAGIPTDTPLVTLGCALAGAEEESVNAQMVTGLQQNTPSGLAEHIFMASDAVGTIVSACQRGGVVLIAGTGSSCRLLNNAGRVHGCGGWAHMIGDGGSATWMALTAVRAVYNHLDNLEPCAFDLTFTESAIRRHFGIEAPRPLCPALLQHLYGDWNKPYFAGLAKALAEGAPHDPYCRHLLHETGHILGRHVRAVSRHADQEMCEGGLDVVIVGSVWKSWNYMRNGFAEGLRPRNGEDSDFKAVNLVKCVTAPSEGIAIHTAHQHGHLKDISVTAPEHFETVRLY